MKEHVFVSVDFLRRLYLSRHMLWTMAVRDLESRYVGSLFGIVWALIYPLFQLGVYGVVFGVFFKSIPDPVYGTDSFFLYLLCGLVPWLFFSQTIIGATDILTTNGSLIKKAVGFPSEILPIVNTIANLISHMIGVGMIFAVLIVSTGTLTILTPLIFVYLFFISIFSVGLGWMVSSLNVYLKDTKQVVGLVTLGWFFFTPVFYSASAVPEELRILLDINPVFVMVEAYRMILLAGELPPLWPLVYLIAVSAAAFGFGGVFFRRLKPGFADVI